MLIRTATLVVCLGATIGALQVAAHAQAPEAREGPRRSVSFSGAIVGTPIHRSDTQEAPRSVTATSVPVAPASTTGAAAKSPQATQAPAAAASSSSSDSTGEKPADWWARGAAALGIVVSIWNAYYGFRKAKRDRRLSIEDDFWFRKILTPTTIEPMLKSFVDLLDAMPTEVASSDDRGEFARRVTKDIQRLQGAVQTLSLLDESLPNKVSLQLQACEDLLVEYAAPPLEGEVKNPGRRETQRRVWEHVNGALRILQQHQLLQ